MRKNILLFLFTSMFVSTYGQDELEINFDSIKNDIENTESNYYYPKLLKRFNEFDSTLTLKEYSLVYYGFSFQDNYIKKPDEEVIDSLLKMKDYGTLVIECQKILDKNPVSLKANDNMGYAQFKLNKPTSEWKKYQDRYRAIRKVIAYSGDGWSPQTAMKVIYVSDEYNMLRSYFEIPKIHRQELVNGGLDKFDVDKSEYYKTNVMYFDISRWLIRYQNLMDGK